MGHRPNYEGSQKTDEAKEEGHEEETSEREERSSNGAKGKKSQATARSLVVLGLEEVVPNAPSAR